MRSILYRYALVWVLLLFMLGIVILHFLGLFPRAGLYDLSRLLGASVVTVEGAVKDTPVLRWGQTRFLLEGCARPLGAFCGKVVVTLPLIERGLAPGDRIRVRGWLSRPKPASQSYWESRRVYTFLKVWKADGFTVLEASPSWSLRRAAWEFQNRYRTFWEERLPWKESALLLGITVGARGVLPPSLKEACIRAGVYHIVVVSGQNMSLLVNVGLLLLLSLTVPRRHALWVCLPLILFYTTAVGADPPVVRAAVTAVVGLIVAALGRDVPPYYPLCIAAGWILIRNPEALLGASFQLSFGATLSILLVYTRWTRTRGNFLSRWFTDSLLLGVSVYLGIWPLLVYYFHRVSLAGFLANWTVFPLSGVLMVIGLILGSWGAYSPATVPDLLVSLTGHLLGWMLSLIEWMAGWSWAVYSMRPPPGWVVGLYYGGLFGILQGSRRRKI